MSKKDRTDTNSPDVQSATEVIDESFGENDLLTADDITSELGDPNGEYSAVKFVKLQPGQGIRGIFRGYLGAEVRAPGGADGKVNFMNVIVLEPRPRVYVKLLGSSQIMQQLILAKPGDTVGIARPNLPEIQIGGGRRVIQYVVAIKGSADKALSSMVSSVPLMQLPGGEQKKLGA